MLGNSENDGMTTTIKMKKMMTMAVIMLMMMITTVTILLTLAFFIIAISHAPKPVLKQLIICIYLLHQVTRYQGWPGQATAYMIGRLGILQARKHATSALGKKFNLKDFHYQVM